MPRTPAALPGGTRISDRISFGHLTSVFSKSDVKRALWNTSKQTIREREFPNHLVVYFVMMMALFRDASQQEVLRVLLDCVQWLFGPVEFKVLAKSSISQARSRVGLEPFKELFDSQVKPLASPDRKHAFFKGLRIVALDGSLFNVADSAENRIFGRAVGPRGAGAFAQTRLVSLVESATHAIFAAEIGGYADSEQALARPLFRALSPNMVCIADRNFMGVELFQLAAQSGCKLLWRVTKQWKLKAEKHLPDGSYLTTVYAGVDKLREKPLKLRVIQYFVDGVKSDPIRLVTNWMDHSEAPADELAKLYTQRWEYEIAMKELKVQLNSNELILRSQKPELVKQELYGMLMAHYAVRKIMHEAASEAGIDDDLLSFNHAINVIRQRVMQTGDFSPCDDAEDPDRDFTASSEQQPWTFQSASS